MLETFRTFQKVSEIWVAVPDGDHFWDHFWDGVSTHFFNFPDFFLELEIFPYPRFFANRLRILWAFHLFFFDCFHRVDLLGIAFVPIHYTIVHFPPR